MALRIPNKTLQDNFQLADLQNDLGELNYLAGGKPKGIRINSDFMIVEYDAGITKTFGFVRDGLGRITKIVDNTDLSETKVTYE